MHFVSGRRRDGKAVTEQGEAPFPPAPLKGADWRKGCHAWRKLIPDFWDSFPPVALLLVCVTSFCRSVFKSPAVLRTLLGACTAPSPRGGPWQCRRFRLRSGAARPCCLRPGKLCCARNRRQRCPNPAEAVEYEIVSPRLWCGFPLRVVPITLQHYRNSTIHGRHLPPLPQVSARVLNTLSLCRWPWLHSIDATRCQFTGCPRSLIPGG